MIINGEIEASPTSEYTTEFNLFYGDMLMIPFFGTYYNYLAPAFILVFSLLFFVISVTKLKNKALGFVKEFKKRKDNSKRNLMRKDKERGLIQNILKGE